MNWLEFIPPVYSILTIGFSIVTASSLRERVGRFVAHTSYAPQEDVIVNIALSWETYVNFFNFIIGAVISIVAILSRVPSSQSFNWLAILVFPLLFIVAPMVHFLSKMDVDQIESRVLWRNFRPVHVCNGVLLGANLLLMLATYTSQIVSPATSAPAQKPALKNGTSPAVPK